MLPPLDLSNTTLTQVEALGFELEKQDVSVLDPLPEEGPPGTRPEAQLLLACARTTVDTETAERIRELLNEDIDWDYVCRKAHRHCITPLLYLNLSTVCPDKVPENRLSQLRNLFFSNARYNLFVTRELLKLLQLLESSGIPSLPFKGPILAAVAYKNLSLRQFGDLDILVHKRDFMKARDLLISQGYREWEPLTRTQKVALSLSRKKDQILISGDGRVRVELHWRLTGRHFSFLLTDDNLWKRLESMSIAGSTVRNLSPEYSLLYLCMHGSRHGWERLGWICDVAELIRTHEEIDWEHVMNQAGQMGNERNLALGLLLATEMLGASLPDYVARRIHLDPVAKSLAAQVWELLFSETDPSLDISYLHRYHLQVREFPSDRLRLRLHYYRRYLHLATTPTARDQAYLSLPWPLTFLYYVVRPIRLIRAHGLRVLGHLLKRAKS